MVIVQIYVRNMSMAPLKEEQVLLDIYMAFTWRQRTKDAALLSRTRAGCAGPLEAGDPAYEAARAAIPQGELMNARDCTLDLANPAALLVFEAESKWGRVETYGDLSTDNIPQHELAPLRAVYHLKGSFSVEDVLTHAVDFPFDVHYPSVVFESWEEIGNLVLVPSPYEQDASSLLDLTSDIPLFPLAEWDMVQGPAEIKMQHGVRLWSFVRNYKSDIFTTDGAALRRGASFSNIVLTFAVSRQPYYFLTQVIPVILIMAGMSVATLRLPLYLEESIGSGDSLTFADAQQNNLSNRLAVMTTLVLAAVAYKLALANVLPITPSMTYLDWHFSVFYAANGVGVTLSVVSYLNPANTQLIDDVATAQFALLYVVSLLHFVMGFARRPVPIRPKALGGLLPDMSERYGRQKKRRLKLRV